MDGANNPSPMRMMPAFMAGLLFLVRETGGEPRSTNLQGGTRGEAYPLVQG